MPVSRDVAFPTLFDTIEDTSAHVRGAGAHVDVASWINPVVIEAVVFNAATVAVGAGSPSSSKTYPAGMTVWGRFTTLHLTSGSLHAPYVPS